MFVCHCSFLTSVHYDKTPAVAGASGWMFCYLVWLGLLRCQRSMVDGCHPCTAYSIRRLGPGPTKGVRLDPDPLGCLGPG